jgi:HSP20 family protein
MDMVEADGEYRLTVELPGMKPEDVEIRLTDGALVMRGTKSEERREETEDRLLSERRYGAFHRSLSLPPGVDAERIAASVSDGVLTVTLPKSAEAKQKERKIEVKAA